MDTETYLTHVKSDFSRRVAADFIVCFVCFALSCVLAYLSVKLFSRDIVYVLASPVSRESVGSLISTALISQLPNAAVLVILFCSVFTVLNRWVTVLLCAWKGTALGVTTCLLMKGSVLGISERSVYSLVAFFLASVLFSSLTALSRVYSEVICHTSVAGERKYTASLVLEYVKLFLIIAGGIFLLGSISTILI